MTTTLPQTLTAAQESVRERIDRTYHQPLPDLLFEAQRMHREHHDPRAVQLCTLCNIKTGLCPEDCGYCSQSVHNKTELEPQPLADIETVLAEATAAKAHGSTRFCMGAAWREVKDGAQFDRVLEMVRQVAALQMEVCCTLGMLKPHQAQRLKEAGLTAYNHNLDTSPEYYGKVITTRTYQDRLETIQAVSAAGISVCCGGILGMGEAVDDRLSLLAALAALDPLPESIPINCLVPVAGTPLQNVAPVDSIELVRMVATTRVLFPKAIVRLSAGRLQMSDELQALCMLAGANSIFTGPVLLTTPNPDSTQDEQLLKRLGMVPRVLQ
ncbi:biotin synthase BioB [Stenomitos frigidus]|uniref:Biotin synthase n=1 Tax=Stenomitos frigidus ULC18 TaxID=2107698 RepID=A0A2T1DT82_9CYAN|nr:biotin synthase BioB [Stenomitos frigidus]PSB23621.1 biotin synthase BioB [Stenomitos frigidus ULC18]